MTQEEAAHQYRQLDKYRKNLTLLRDTVQHYGAYDLAPLDVRNSINDTIATIIEIKGVLRSNNYPVQGVLDDTRIE